jgi:hypothetical protein
MLASNEDCDNRPNIPSRNFSSDQEILILTTVPGTRDTLFYSAPDADPATIKKDEARKDVVSVTLLATGAPIATTTATLAIHVPFLTILGSNDVPTCGPNPQGEWWVRPNGILVFRCRCLPRRRNAPLLPMFAA